LGCREQQSRQVTALAPMGSRSLSCAQRATYEPEAQSIPAERCADVGRGMRIIGRAGSTLPHARDANQPPCQRQR
jgi:hypothetical protein